MTHARLHALLLEGKISPEQAAALVMARARNRERNYYRLCWVVTISGFLLSGLTIAYCMVKP